MATQWYKEKENDLYWLHKACWSSSNKPACHHLLCLLRNPTAQDLYCLNSCISILKLAEELEDNIYAVVPKNAEIPFSSAWHWCYDLKQALPVRGKNSSAAWFTEILILSSAAAFTIILDSWNWDSVWWALPDIEEAADNQPLHSLKIDLKLSWINLKERKVLKWDGKRGSIHFIIKVTQPWNWTFTHLQCVAGVRTPFQQASPPSALLMSPWVKQWISTSLRAASFCFSLSKSPHGGSSQKGGGDCKDQGGC